MYRPQEEIDIINSMYKICNGNASKAIRKLRKKGMGIGRETVRQFWKKEGYEPGQQGGRRKPLNKNNNKRATSDYDKQQIIKA